MNIEKMREEFEAAYMRNFVEAKIEDSPLWLDRGSDGEYRSYQARGAWWGWQTSRATIVVELPELFPFYKQGVVEALEAAGLKVKQ